MSETTDHDLLEWVRPSVHFDGVRIAVTRALDVHKRFGSSFFNLGLNVEDDPAQVHERRAWLEQKVGAPIQWLNQVHGNEVLSVIDSKVLDHSSPEAQKDAAATTRNDVALAVLTADCLPVVFYAQGHCQAVGVAHAGWRGLASGVLENTAQRVAQLAKVNANQVDAWLGAAIGPLSYEVGGEVRKAFIDQNQATEAAFKPSSAPHKYMADLYQLATIRLLALGVSVQGGGQDTFTNLNLFSHRAHQVDRLRPAGRFATLVRLAPSL